MKLHHMLLNKEGADKGSGGDGLDSVLKEMENIPRVQGKSALSDKGDDKGGKKDVKGRQDPKDIEDDDKEDGEEEGESVLADALKGAKDNDRKPKEEAQLTDEQKKAKAEADKPKETKDTYDKDFPELNDRGVSPNVGQKFKRLKEEAITKLREKDKAISDAEAKIKELEGKAPTGSLAPEEFDKHPEVVKLKATLQQQQELIEKIRLEESPTFKKAYDEKINETVRKALPILKMIQDERKLKSIGERIDTLMRLEAGEDGDVQFFKGLGDLLEDSGLNAVLQGRVITALESGRDLINQKAGKLTDWQNASKENASLEVANRQQSVKATVGALDAARSQYHNGLADKIGFFKKNEAVFGYDNITTPLYEKAKAEIAKSAETGQLTPEAIRFINAGVDMPFFYNLTESLQNLVTTKNAKIKEQEEELVKLRDADPSKGSRDRGSRKNGFEGKKEDGDDDDPADRNSGSVLGAALKKRAGVR